MEENGKKLAEEVLKRMIDKHPQHEESTRAVGQLALFAIGRP